MVSLNKALLSPDFWGGTLEWGRLTSHENAGFVKHMAMYNSGDIFAMFPRISVAYAMDFLQRERESVVLWQTLESIHVINICGYIQYMFGLRYAYIYIYIYLYIFFFLLLVIPATSDLASSPKKYSECKGNRSFMNARVQKNHGMYTARCNP